MKTCELIENIRLGKNEAETINAIDLLTHEERINIREVLSDNPLPRNLFYDYSKQCWI